MLRLLLSISALVLICTTAIAENQLSIARLFTDHMVLQQGRETHIWGKAAPETGVSVSFAGQSLKVKTNENGDWVAKFSALSTNAKGSTLTVSSGDQKIEISDVLVGEVWMCSGQSNMGWAVSRSHNAEEEIANAKHPKIRLFQTHNKTSTTAHTDYTTGEHWQICSPETIATFSAVGYYFGRELSQNLNVPIGLINTAWGGKPSEAFTTREKLASTETGKDLLGYWDSLQAQYDPDTAQSRYDQALATFQEKQKAAREAFKKDKTPMPRLKRPEVPTDPHLKPNAPAAIYNYKIAPATPYAIAGAIWYQGESNSSRAAQYEHIFPAMIEDWRAQWGYDFPFYFVQLANFRTPSEAPGTPSSWAELQNAQRITLQKTPNTGMAIINDIGEAKDIHPGNKQDVGKRLSRLALGEHYQSGLTPTSGPLYRSHEIKDGSITVTFDHVGTGLKKRDTQAALGRFEIAGDDQVWKWADASINQDGKTVTVSSKEVAAPVAVRYAWADNPEGANLVNSAGTPASLFRTDDWELSTQGLNFPGSKSFATLKAEAINRNTKLEKQGWEVLFNGYDLTGWTNPYQHGKVSVDNGEIHLEADKKFFLVTEKTYSDFTLRVDIKLPEGKANSGVMFRANVQPGKVFGYQAECDGSDRRWSGGLYDEGRRGWIWPSTPGKSKEEFLSHSEESLAHMAEPKVQNALKRNDWNTYMIRCLGDNISITVNGVRVTQIKDSTDAEGVIGIQHHGEKGAVYKFRNLYLKPL